MRKVRWIEGNPWPDSLLRSPLKSRQREPGGSRKDKKSDYFYFRTRRNFLKSCNVALNTDDHISDRRILLLSGFLTR